MNWNQIESNWKQLKSNIQQQWAELTEDDLDNMSGNRDELTNKIQQTYGMDRQNAENEVDAWQSSQQDLEDDEGLDDNNNSHKNKFGYDESSSSQIQSGKDNRNMPGTNNLSTDGLQTDSSKQGLNDTNKLRSDAFNANYDNFDANDSNNRLTGVKGTITLNNSNINKSAAGDGQKPSEYVPSTDNDGSEGPGDAGGIPGESNEDETDENDGLNNPNPNPMPDDFNSTNRSGNIDGNLSNNRLNIETPHQEKSLDQT